MVLLGLFAALAVTLAAVGISGVMAHRVSQRVREIGIRVALGARPSDVLWLLLSQGLRLTAIGLVLGLAGALALTRGLSALLFHVSPRDPAAFGAIGLLLAAVALAACYLPSRRAARLDPSRALRTE
jgi:ABC-type antimicrobial peptide transport system permease subunit